MKVDIETNFSFSNLASKLPNIIKEHVAEVGKDSVLEIKDSIDRGLKPKLKKSTMAVRKARGISGSIPLKATGAFYNSIKYTEDGIEMLEYGKYHRWGFTPKKIPRPYKDKSGKTSIQFIRNKNNIKVPSRNFTLKTDWFPSPRKKEITKNLIKSIKNGMKK